MIVSTLNIGLNIGAAILILLRGSMFTVVKQLINATLFVNNQLIWKTFVLDFEKYLAN